VPGGGPRESLLERAAFPVVLLVLALFLTFRIAWLLRRPGSLEQKGRGLKITIPASLLAVTLGAILISMIIAGEHWRQLFWRD